MKRLKRETFHNVIIIKIVLLVELLNSELNYIFVFVIIFLVLLLQDSVITRQNDLKISFIEIFI